MKTYKQITEAGDVGEYVVTQGAGDNAQKVIAVEKDKNKAIKIRDDWNKKNNPSKPSHRARVYAQTKISLKRNKQKVGQDISWSTYGNKGQFTKLKEVISPLSKGTQKHIDRVRDANDARLQKLRAARRKKNPTFMDKLKKGFKK